VNQRLDPKEITDLLLSSEVKGDLLSLFHRNPGLIDTLEGVALRVGRRGEAIEDDVVELIELGLLKSKRIGDQKILTLDRARDRELQAILAEHVRTSTGGIQEKK
jgi:hypothetical protein